MKKEEEYYPLIKTSMEEVLKTKTTDVYLEITASKKFSDRLKNEIQPERDIIFNFLKQAAPDIPGFIKVKNSSNFIVIEFKTAKLKLDDIYQAKKYRDLFGASYTFLISLEPIPEEIKRLNKALNDQLVQSGLSYFQTFVLCWFELKQKKFLELYPENPFEKEGYWK